MNERRAGEGGYIAAKDGRFVHSKTGQPVRFWGVNGPASKEVDGFRRDAKVLAKRGVNLVRTQLECFDPDGNVDKAAVASTLEMVKALADEGIYTHFSVYFPLKFNPKPDNPWIKGYDGNTHAFAALYFNREFQKHYWALCQALLQTPRKSDGVRLANDPALAGIEIINEDSYLFWTFDPKNIPDPQLRIVEAQFGTWLKTQYGSLATAMKRWGSAANPRDNLREGRMTREPVGLLQSQE